MSSKLIPHIIQQTAAAMTWAAHALAHKRLNGPGTIGRHWWPDSEQNARIAQMAVDRTFTDIMGDIGPQTEYVEVLNEVAQRQGLGLEQHADFLEAIVPKFHDRGLKVIGFNFSVGNPGLAAYGERDDMQYLYNRKFCGADAIGSHAYWGPRGFTEPFALRYRVMHRAVPSHPPFVLTECGRDAVEGGQSGWKASGLTGAQYLAELANFDAELAKDDYVLWAAVFTAGPTPDWEAFSTDGLDMSRFYVGGTPPMAIPHNTYCTELGPDGQAGNRCGPAALASVLLAKGWQSDPWQLTLELTHETPGCAGDNLPGGSTSDQLITVCGLHGQTAHKWYKQAEMYDALAAGQYVLGLLDNWLLRPRMYPTWGHFDALHWVRVVSVIDDATVLLHDPLSWPYQGPTVAARVSLWEAILATPAYESGIVIG